MCTEGSGGGVSRGGTGGEPAAVLGGGEKMWKVEKNWFGKILREELMDGVLVSKVQMEGWIGIFFE